jgi:hypothetical protein
VVRSAEDFSQQLSELQHVVAARDREIAALKERFVELEKEKVKTLGLHLD